MIKICSWCALGAMTGVEAEKKAAAEQALREKHEARGIEAEQEL